MEAALDEWFKNHDLEATDIHCPENQKMETGNVFSCTGDVHGVEVPVFVEVTDASTGRVEWKPKFHTMKGEEFASEIKANDAFKDHDIDVTCTDKVMVSVPKSTWKCEIVDKNEGNKVFDTTVTFTDGKGTHDIAWVEKAAG